jgi:hypothetical protein
MKFVPVKSNGVEGFINSANVFFISPVKNIIGRTAIMSSAGLSIEVEGSPSEIAEKLEGTDKPLF